MSRGRGGPARLPAGIPGFDQIADGGLPLGRAALVVGTSGSGKTVFAVQFLVAGVHAHGQNGVLVSFEEPAEDLVEHFSERPWGLDELVAQGRIEIVDVSLVQDEEHEELGPFDFGALLVRIERAVARLGAERVVLDSVGSLFALFRDAAGVRRELRRVIRGLRRMGVTTVVTSERIDEYGSVGRYGLEEFVVNGVIVLRNPLEMEKRRRTIEILKFRGASHKRGEYPFTIDPQGGLSVIPYSAIELDKPSAGLRVSTGVPDLDRMCGGGVFTDGVMLVSGPTGAGKTLIVSQFVRAAFEHGERALLLTFEENREQLVRNAASWGVDLAAAERAGLLQIVARYPERMSLEDLLMQVRQEVDAFGPRRVALDSLTVLEHTQAVKPFREFVVGLTTTLKERDIAAVFTNTTSALGGGATMTESHVSTISDAVVLLRYVETPGAVRRALTVLKMRGSRHDTSIREFVIGDTGMEILGPLTEVSGRLGGSVVAAGPDASAWGVRAGRFGAG